MRSRCALALAVFLAAVGMASCLTKLTCPKAFINHVDVPKKLTSVYVGTVLPSAADCCAFCGIYESCVIYTWKSSTRMCQISFSNATVDNPENATVMGVRGISPSPAPSPPVRPIRPNPPLGFQPNLLLLFPDEWRSDWDGFHNDEYPGGIPLPLRMPNMAGFARQGTRFLHAFVPSPLCAPSRGALAAGREYDHSGVAGNGNDYPEGQATFYLQLQRAGYHTMLVGKDDLNKDSQLGAFLGQYQPNGRYRMHELGVSDGMRTAGKDSVIKTYPVPHDEYGIVLGNHTFNGISAWDAHYSCGWHKDKMQNRTLCNRETFPDALYQDNWVADTALDYLDRRPKDTPWFMQVNFPGPHPPFLVTGSMADRVANRTWPGPVDSTTKTGRDKCRNMAEPGEPEDGDNYQLCNYGAELENLDRLFGKVVGHLGTIGELEHTVICIASDHGDLTGDHNGAGKSTPWQQSVSVPLLCFGGSNALKIGAGQVVNEPTATMDLAATFIDYAGGELADGMTSTSLRPVLEGHQQTVRDYVSSGLNEWRMVVKEVNGTWYKFICGKGEIKYSPSTAAQAGKDGWQRLLYAIEDDPFDMHDLSVSQQLVMQQLSALLPGEFTQCGWKN